MIPPPQKLKFYLIDSDLRVTNIETNESIVNRYKPKSILATLCFLLAMNLLVWMQNLKQALYCRVGPSNYSRKGNKYKIYL